MVTPTSLDAARIRWSIDPAQDDALCTRRHDVVVGWPARLLAQMREGFLSVDAVEVLVLDACERLDHAGYASAIRRIARQLPADRHDVLLSRSGGSLDHQRLLTLLASGPRGVDAGTRESPVSTVSVVHLSATDDAIETIRAIFGAGPDYRLSPFIQRG